MNQLELNVLGVSETRWEVAGDLVSDGFRVIFSGSKGGQKGVAIIVDGETTKRVIKIV